MLPHLQGSLYGSHRPGSHNAVHTFPVAFDTTGISSGIKVGTILASPAKPVVVRVGYLISEAFNAATTNVLTAGTTSTATEWIDQNVSIEATTGFSGPKVAGSVYYDNIAIAAATGGMAALDLTQAAPISGASVVSPAHPRNVTLRITDANASISAIDIYVAGTNIMGEVVSEYFNFASFTALNATGNVAFATITSVTVTSVTGDSAGDVLDMGFGVKIGVPFGPGWSVSKVNIAGVADTNTGTQNATYGTVITATAPNDTRDFSFFYSYNQPSTSGSVLRRLTSNTDIYVKYVQTGTAATTGAASLVVEEYEENVRAIV